MYHDAPSMTLDEFNTLLEGYEDVYFKAIREHIFEATEHWMKDCIEKGYDTQRTALNLIPLVSNEAARMSVKIALAILLNVRENPETPVDLRSIIKRIK